MHSSANLKFEDVYRDLCDPVARLCLNVTGNKAIAEEATQETFLLVYRSLSGFRGEAKVSTWIYRIALREAIRARARRPELLPESEPMAEGMHAALEAKDEVARLRSAMERLSTEQRMVISLFAIDGMGHREIAELLGVPEGTVWSRLHLARKRLSVELDRGG